MQYSRELKFISNGDGTCYVGGTRKCRSKNIVIPPVSPDGDSVTSIGDRAFSNCTSLTSVTGNYKAFLLQNGKIYAKQNHTEYRIGEKLECTGDLIPCENGLHYCTNMFDIFNYYYGEYGQDFVVAECEVSEENVGQIGDSKRCARWIRPIKLLTRQEVIDRLNNKQ